MSYSTSYEITPDRHLSYLGTPFIFCLVIFVAAYAALISLHDSLVLIFGFFIGFGLYVLPTLIIHLVFSLKDQHKRLTLEDGMFVLTMNDTILKKTSMGNIRKVVIRKRDKPGDIGIVWFSWHYYYYFDVFFNDGTTVRLTCLMFDRKEILPLPRTETRDISFPILVKAQE